VQNRPPAQDSGRPRRSAATGKSTTKRRCPASVTIDCTTFLPQVHALTVSSSLLSPDLLLHPHFLSLNLSFLRLLIAYNITHSRLLPTATLSSLKAYTALAQVRPVCTFYNSSNTLYEEQWFEGDEASSRCLPQGAIVLSYPWKKRTVCCSLSCCFDLFMTFTN
jgi:hypothetical protein